MMHKLNMKLLGLFTLLLCGCLGPVAPSYFLYSVSVQVDHDANNKSATPVDLVVIYDDQLHKEILAMNADKYFSSAKQLKRDHVQKMEVFHWEVVPGQTLNFDQLSYKKSSPVGAVIFARYLTPGEHRKSVGTEEYLVIHLLKEGFETYSVEEINSENSVYKESE